MGESPSVGDGWAMEKKGSKFSSEMSDVTYVARR